MKLFAPWPNNIRTACGYNKGIHLPILADQTGSLDADTETAVSFSFVVVVTLTYL